MKTAKKHCIAVIPARGGSKGIPRKNIRPLLDYPLIWYVIKSALTSKIFTHIVVTTDDEEIAYLVSFFKNISVVMRPKHLAEDNVPLDPVVYHAVTQIEKENNMNFDFVFTLQPTSPLLSPNTIKKAYMTLLTDKYDTVVTVKDATHLYWLQDKNGNIKPLFEKRQNRQYLPKIYVENGALIATKRNFLTPTSRFGPKVYLLKLDGDESVDIDSSIDWFVAEQILKRKRIIFRVDGDFDIGLGHIYRALTIAHRMIGHEIIFLMDSNKKLGIEKVKEYNYKIITFTTQKEMFQHINTIKPDILINDILDTSVEYMYSLKQHKIFVVNFEDLGNGADLADIVFNALYEFSHPPKNRFYGYKYVILRDEFVYTPFKKVTKNVKNLLITFGGVDQNNLTMKALNAIDLLGLKNINVDIIVGLGYKWTDKLEDKIIDLNSRGFNIHFIKNPKIIAKYIYKSDLAITSNGRTIYEISSIGVPCISISQNERENLHLFSKISGAIINLGLATHTSVTDMAEAIDRLIKDFNLRKEMNKKMKNFDLRNGTKRVIKIMFEKYNMTNEGDIFEAFKETY